MENLIHDLTAEEQLLYRSVEAAELRAHAKMHEFKEMAEVQLKGLQDTAVARTQATMAHVQALAKKYELALENYTFDFERLAFVPKQK